MKINFHVQWSGERGAGINPGSEDVTISFKHGTPSGKPDADEIDFRNPKITEAWTAGFELAHELQKCGHSRGDCRDDKYIPGVSETCESRCIGCEREKKLKEEFAAGTFSLRASGTPEPTDV